MRVLVTGGAGFIGSALVDRLQDEDNDVAVVDVVPPAGEVAFVEASVLDAGAMREVVRDVDVVAHLAGFVRGGMRAQPYEGATLQLQGTANVLEACRVNAVPHLALASSFYVYDGRPADETVDEGTSLDPLAMELFGSAKLMSEALCREWADAGGPSATAFRIGPVYGGKGSSAVDELVETGLRGETIDIWGRGDRRNQYTFVGDVADAMTRALVHPGETYNLVAPDAVSLRALGEMLRQGYGFHTTFDESRPEGPSFPYISPAKAMDRLGWRPRPLDEGLQALVPAPGDAAR
jgi:UDP-glucose 4-epimerase